MKILIAEDAPASRMALKTILQKWGHEIVVAGDGNHAWKILQTDSPKLAQARTEVVISDIVMPRMDGVELLWNHLNRPYN